MDELGPRADAVSSISASHSTLVTALEMGVRVPVVQEAVWCKWLSVREPGFEFWLFPVRAV